MFVNLKIILFLLMIIKTCVILLIYLLESIQHVSLTCIGARFLSFSNFKLWRERERERERERDKGKVAREIEKFVMHDIR